MSVEFDEFIEPDEYPPKDTKGAGALQDKIQDLKGNAVRDSVKDSVRDSVKDSVRDSVKDSVRDSVRTSDEISDQLIKDASKGGTDLNDLSKGNIPKDGIRGKGGNKGKGGLIDINIGEIPTEGLVPFEPFGLDFGGQIINTPDGPIDPTNCSLWPNSPYCDDDFVKSKNPLDWLIDLIISSSPIVVTLSDTLCHSCVMVQWKIPNPFKPLLGSYSKYNPISFGSSFGNTAPYIICKKKDNPECGDKPKPDENDSSYEEYEYEEVIGNFDDPTYIESIYEYNSLGIPKALVNFFPPRIYPYSGGNVQRNNKIALRSKAKYRGAIYATIQVRRFKNLSATQDQYWNGGSYDIFYRYDEWQKTSIYMYQKNTSGIKTEIKGWNAYYKDANRQEYSDVPTEFIGGFTDSIYPYSDSEEFHDNVVDAYHLGFTNNAMLFGGYRISEKISFSEKPLEIKPNPNGAPTFPSVTPPPFEIQGDDMSCDCEDIGRRIRRIEKWLTRPLRVPDTILSKEGDSQGVFDWIQPDKTRDLKDFHDVFKWSLENLSAILGGWGQQLEIEVATTETDSDGSPKTVMKKQTVFNPDIATSLSRLTLMVSTLSDDEISLKRMIWPCLLEAHMSRQQGIMANHTLDAILDYLGGSVQIEEKKIEIPTTFTLTEDSLSGAMDNAANSDEELDLLMKPSKVPLAVNKYVGGENGVTLTGTMKDLLEAAAIIKAVHTVRYNKGASDATLKNIMKGLIAGYKLLRNNQESDFGDFIDAAELGFPNNTGNPDPYGEPYDQRPRIRDFGIAKDDTENPTP